MWKSHKRCPRERESTFIVSSPLPPHRPRKTIAALLKDYRTQVRSGRELISTIKAMRWTKRVNRLFITDGCLANELGVKMLP